MIKEKMANLGTRLQALEVNLRTNECASNPCKHGGTCEDGYHRYICHCPREWQGTDCTQDVNECAEFTGSDLGCHSNSICRNIDGGFRCECSVGYYGIHCGEQHDNCTGASHKELCGHGVCVNLGHQEAEQGSNHYPPSSNTDGMPIEHSQFKYNCICDEGWTTDGLNPACQVDVDECNGTTICSVEPQVQCINLPGSFSCGQCPKGYAGNGFACVDIDECQDNNGGCSQSPLVDCKNTKGSHSCGSCPPGFQGDGRQCKYVGFCYIDNGGCNVMAICTENAGAEVSCSCPVGYSGSGIGPDSCVTNSVLAGCVSNPCKNGGTCEPQGDSNFNCTCTSDFLGPTCEDGPDPCEDVICDNGGNCTASSDGRSSLCSCMPGFTGFSCEMREQECSGPLIGEEGYFQYPMEPGTSYAHHASCAWTIFTHRHMALVVTFQSFSLEPPVAGECKKDYLQINDGPTTSSLNMGSFCGYDLPNGGTINSTSDQLHLLFRSDSSNSGEGFSLSWTSHVPTCGKDLSGSNQGQIRSPGYPDKKYLGHRDCVWTVAVGLNSNIKFTFSYINLESHFTCDYDFVEILDGQTEEYPVLKKICTSGNSAAVITGGPWAFIRFHSDGIGSDRGFQISYTANTENRQGCGGYFSGHDGSVQSPGYPGVHHRKGVCVWIIATASYTHVKLTFSSFDLGSCSHSSLKIRDGKDQRAPTLGAEIFCGTQSPGVVKSSSSYILIELHTDEFATGQGFQASWTTGCGGQFSNLSPVKQIASPGWPRSYHHNLECIYTIIVPEGFKVLLSPYIRMRQAVTTSCDKTYLEFFDGTDITAPHVPPKVCHYERPYSVRSTGSSLTIKFKSDISHDYLKFTARYRRFSSRGWSCERHINSNSGRISTDELSRRDKRGCRWIITTSPGTFVRVTFNSFNVGRRGWSCSPYRGGLVTVKANFPYRVSGHSYRKIQRYCGHRRIQPKIYEYNSIKISYSQKCYRFLPWGHWRSRRWRFRRSPRLRMFYFFGWHGYWSWSCRQNQFSASFEAVNMTDCGGNLDHMSGTIQTPNYPGAHPHDVQCIWTITVPEGHQIRLKVVDFDMEPSRRCNIDYLELRDGGFADSPLVGKYCGRASPRLKFSRSNRYFIKFVSTSYYMGLKKGFRMTFDGGATGCGGVLVTGAGGFTSPGFPEQSLYSAECFWTIQVSMGNRVLLHFDHFDVDSDDDCTIQYVEVRDGGGTGSVLGKFCNQRKPGLISSQTRSVWVKYKSDNSYSGTGLLAHYATHCRDSTFRDHVGVIESPDLPYQIRHACMWEIRANPGNRVNISFAAFNLQEDGNRDCSGDDHDLLVLSYHGMSGPSSTKQFCGSSPPNNVISTKEIVLLAFRSNGLIHGQGFRLEWRVAGCGGDLTRPSGTLYVDNHAHNRRLVCDWTITVPPGQKVRLEITRFRYINFLSPDSGVLEVYAGLDQQGPRLLQLSQRVEPLQIQSVESTGNTMFVHFDGRNISSLKVNATYAAVAGGCGGNFTAHSSLLTSPDNTGLFQPNSECEWYIRVDENHAVEFTFTSLDVEDNNDNCNNSYVRLYDGYDSSASLLTSQCGTELPSPAIFKSNGSTIYVQLRTGGTRTGGHVTQYIFSATYTSSCGGTRNADNGGFIKNPVKYVETRCVWHIVSQIPTRRVSLTFTEFAVTAFQDGACGSSYMSIADGIDPSPNITGTIQNSYCGHNIPATYHSFGSAITVVFVSRFPDQQKFRAIYSSADNGCGGNFSANAGSFTSPWFPANYPSNIECVWQINTLPGNGLVLTFSQFELQDGFNDDYLEIRSPDIHGETIHRMYGTMMPPTYSFYGGVWIKFRSNENNTGPGFSASWSANFDMFLSGTHGKILSPQRAVLGSEYSWTIVVNQGFKIGLSINAKYIRGVCISNYLVIYDGTVNEGRQLRQICSFHHRLFRIPTIYSTINQMTIKFKSQHYSNSFNLTWNAVLLATDRPTSEAQEQGCGDRLVASGAQQNLTNPGYPLGYANDLDCTWTIQAPVGNTVVINLTNIETEKHGESCYDYVQFLDGNQDGRPIGKYCGNMNNSHVIESRNHTLTVRFISDDKWNLTGFALLYEIGCGGLVSGTRGKISSPGYPGLYPPDQNCTWQVSVPAGRTINLEWDGFDIKSGENSTSESSASDGQCSRDYLQLFNGENIHAPPLVSENSSNMNGQYCGTSPPEGLETGSHYLSAMFVSDEADAGSGFSFNFAQVHVACGEELTLTYAMTSGFFTSPNYPDNYPSNVDCWWFIRAPVNKAVQIDFERPFEIQNATGCTNDYLTFLDGGTEHAHSLEDPLCGYTRPPTIKSTGNYLTARFLTDSNTTYRGFKAKYSIARCGGTVVASLARGILHSPDIPESNRANLTCQWVIEAPLGHYLTMNITHIGLLASENCSSGALTIIDPFQSTNVSVTSGAVDANLPDIGDIDDTNSLFHGCSLRATNIDGHRFLHRSYDTSDYLAYIKFWSNTVFTERAFTIHYQASLEECGGELTTPSGAFTSPHYPRQYAHSRTCTWDIKVMEGRKVALSFTDFHFEDSFPPSCHSSFVEIRNGLYPDSPILGRHCGSSTPDTIFSSGNNMRVTFKIADSARNGRFRAEYNSDNEADCGGVLRNATGGFIRFATSSPNVQCVWAIQNPAENASTLIRIVNIRLESSPGCKKNFLEILEGDDLSFVRRTCRNGWQLRYANGADEFGIRSRQQDSVILPFSNVFVRFRTDESRSRRLFKLQYAVNYCGSTITDPEGVISLPINQTGIPKNCVWLITAPVASRVQVHFLNFSLDSSCNEQSVEILNGGSYDSPSIGEFCNSSIPDDIISQSHQLRIILSTNYTTHETEFRLEYFFIKSGCGGVYHRNQGHLHSPNFPHSYPNNAQCEWIINVEQGYFVRLRFNPHFDLEVGNPCQNDFVQVYDVNSSGERILLGTWCRNRKPPDLKSSSTQMVVLFQTNAITNGNGFKADWSAGCGAVITANEAEIISPGFPKYGNNLQCNYSLIPSGNKFISLHFSTFELQGGGANCPFDWVAVYKNEKSNNSLLAKMCGLGYGLNENVVRTKGQAFLEFRTDEAETFKGFKAQYLAFDCGGELNASHGDFYSPGFFLPGHYLNNINCTWTITAPEDKVIVAKFYNLDIFETPRCTGDYLDIFDGEDSALLYHLCGKKKPIPFKSSTNKLSFTFVSDNSLTGRGFDASYYLTTACGGVIQQPNGTLAVPEQNDIFCEWTILAVPGKVISLTVNEIQFSHWSSQVCRQDNKYLQIYDGPRKNEHLLIHICDTSVSERIKSSSNSMDIVLHNYVPYYTTRTLKFNISFEQEDAPCPQSQYTALTSSEVLSFPGTSSLSVTELPLRCMSNFNSGADNRQVSISVTRVPTDTPCNDEFLELHDNPIDPDGQKAKVCSSSTVPFVFYSKGRNVSAVYHRKVASNSSGFLLSYSLADCNRTYTGLAGRITSPGFPDDFPFGSQCTMEIAGPEGTLLALYFTQFFVEAHNESCLANFLQVPNSSMGKKCGVAIPSPVFLSSNTATVNLRTDGNTTGNYAMVYVASDAVSGCGGNLTDIDHGLLTNPGYPDTPQGSQDCTWRLTTSYGQLRVHFESVIMPGKDLHDCSVSYVQVGNQKFCTTYNVNFSYDNRIIIVRYKSTAGSPATVFKLKFYRLG